MIRQSVSKAWFASRCGVPSANVFRECRPITSTTSKHFSVSPNNSNKTSEKSSGFDDLDKPIKFTTSQASKLTAERTLGGDAFPNSPWYQPYVVTFSVSIFLIYFLVLREENDVDEYIGQPLWQKVPSLERQQLQMVLEYNRINNLDTKDIERRLKEIEQVEKQARLQQK